VARALTAAAYIAAGPSHVGLGARYVAVTAFGVPPTVRDPGNDARGPGRSRPVQRGTFGAPDDPREAEVCR